LVQLPEIGLPSHLANHFHRKGAAEQEAVPGYLDFLRKVNCFSLEEGEVHLHQVEFADSKTAHIQPAAFRPPLYLVNKLQFLIL
jgi:hypothetical protein